MLPEFIRHGGGHAHVKLWTSQCVTFCSGSSHWSAFPARLCTCFCPLQHKETLYCKRAAGPHGAVPPRGSNRLHFGPISPFRVLSRSRLSALILLCVCFVIITQTAWAERKHIRVRRLIKFYCSWQKKDSRNTASTGYTIKSQALRVRAVVVTFTLNISYHFIDL